MRTRGVWSHTRDELVALEFVIASLFHEDIGFIDKDKGFPLGCQRQRIIQHSFDVVAFGPEITTSNRIEGSLGIVRYALCRHVRSFKRPMAD